MDHTEVSPATKSRKPGRSTVIAAIVALAVVAGIVGLIVWAIGVSRSSETEGNTVDRYRTDYESAMQKAGVEATFPGQIVDLSDVDATGAQPFEATFTADEVTALLSIYRYQGGGDTAEMAVTEAQVSFPSAGQVKLSGRIVYQGSGYSATIEAPVTYDGSIDSPGATSLNVSGFNVSGEQRKQATSAVVDYFNGMLSAAPGLRVEQAQIVEGGVQVTGTAPVTIEQPIAPAQP